MRTSLETFLLGTLYLFTLIAPALGSHPLSQQVQLRSLLTGREKNLSRIQSGEALNVLVDVIRENRLYVDSQPLRSVEVAHIRLQRGGGGLAFSADGELLQFCLPAELLTNEYSKVRHQLGRTRSHVLQQLQRGELASGNAADFLTAVDQMGALYTANGKPAACNASGRTLGRYRTVRRLLYSVRDEIVNIERHEGGLPDTGWQFHGRTVAELIDHLEANYLRFAPCRYERTGLATYTLIYEILLRAVTPIRGELVGELEARLEEKARVAAEKREERDAQVHKRAKKRGKSRAKRIEERLRLDNMWRSYWRNLPAEMRIRGMLQRNYWPYQNGYVYRVPTSRGRTLYGTRRYTITY